MKPNILFSVLILLLIGTNKVFPYEVWIGTTCTPHNAAVMPETWARTASLVSGLNINFANCMPDPGTPSENETACTNADWKVIMAQYDSANNGMVPIPRSGIRHPLRPEKPLLPDFLTAKFESAASFGYGISSIMFYNNKLGDISYNWTVAEIQEMRDWLDSNNHAGVRLIWNARNNSADGRVWCSNKLVDDILLEAEPGKWFENTGSRQDLLKWLDVNVDTRDKRLIFQIPVSGVEHPFGNPSGYQQVRRMIRWLGTDLMDSTFLRNPKVIFMPVTYNYPTFTFYPETESPTLYTNTLTSIVLSLIEQKDLFEGRGGYPTLEAADSYVRTPDDGTGISNPSGSNDIAIYPNPCHGSQLHIKLPEGNQELRAIEIIDGKGGHVLLSDPGQFRSGISISKLLPGTYFVRLRLTDGMLTRKLIVSGK